ncbi:hypothetical protein ScPMuIL_001770 [Solemya velum]
MAMRPNERSAVNIFIKLILFLVNTLLFLLGLALWGTMTWILVVKEKKVEMLVDFVFDLSCLLCLFGAMMNVFSLCGCWGALRENITLLKIYNWSVTILLLLQVVGVIFVFVFYYVPESRTSLNLYPEGLIEDGVERYWVDDDMKNLLDDMQQTRRVRSETYTRSLCAVSGDKPTHAVSVSCQEINLHTLSLCRFQCCGGSTDDEGYKDWNRNTYFNCSGDSQWKCSVPFSCCKLKAGESINFLCGKGALDTHNGDTSAINTRGCLKGFEDWMNDNMLVIGGVTLGIIIPQLVLVWMARTLIEQIKQQYQKQEMNRRIDEAEARRDANRF